MSRRAKVTVAGIGVLVLLLVYGTGIEPRFILDVEEFAVEVPGLDEGASVSVAMFADLQVGMWWDNTGMVARVVDRTLEADPDLVLLGGDFLYSESPDIPAQVDTVLELLSPLTDAGVPLFAVLGNHDYATGAAEEITDALEQSGITVLRNEVAPVPAAGDLHVVGIGPARPERADVDEALRGLPADAPRVVLMHNPTTFPELPASTAPIALAGHTHCGQISLPGMPHWSYLGLTKEEAFVADGFPPPDFGAEGNRMFVSCGIGFSLIPVRIGAPPQLVLVELVPG